MPKDLTLYDMGLKTNAVITTVDLFSLTYYSLSDHLVPCNICSSIKMVKTLGLCRSWFFH